MPWHEHLEHYQDHLRAANRSAGTIKLRFHYLHRFAETFPEPWSVTPNDLSRWMTQSEWAPETMKSARAALVGFYKWAHRFELIDRDPTRWLPAVHVPRTLPRPAPGVVLREALRDASGRDKLMIMLAAYAGLRRNEIACLRWADMVDGNLHVTGKGERARIVPMLPELETELHRIRAGRVKGEPEPGWRFLPAPDSPYVFPGARGGHMHADTVGKLLHERLGAREWSGHTLRHRFATRAFEGTRDLRAVQELLGHSKPETTARYVAVSTRSLRDAVAAAR